MNFSIRKSAGLLLIGGLILGLLGSGVGASYLDTGSATENINVGTFACTVSSPTLGAIVSNNGHSVTYAAPDIISSSAGSAYFDATLTNTGSVSLLAHWTITASPGVVLSGPYNPGVQDFAATAGPNGNLITTDVTLAPGANHAYTNLGLQWITLVNSDLNSSQWVTYTASCGELPPPVTSKISFVGINSGPLAAAPSTKITSGSNYVWTWTGPNSQLAWGTGSQGAGVLNVTSTSAFAATGPWVVSVATTLGVAPYASPATISCTGKTTTSFTGCTTIAGGGMLSTNNVVTGPTPSLALPAGWQPGDYAVVYASGAYNAGNQVPTAPGTWTGVFGVHMGYNNGADAMVSVHVLAAGDGALVDASATQAMVAVYRGVAGYGGVYIANPGNNQNWGCSPTLTKTDSSSWVVCLGGDISTSPFNVAAAYGPTAFAGTVNRSASLTDKVMGLSDTNGGVSAWSVPIYASGDYAHGGANAGIEILSK